MDEPEVRPGRVTLVGAGPGGADLITVRGARALATADVVVHDQLVDPDVLELARHGALRIAVGKVKGGGTPQDEINCVLVREARRGQHVVRLKGGDPFVFGRGGEEVDVVAAAGIAVTVVPGLTSALAGPALAGIPITHRAVAASALILSGHRAGTDDYDWTAISRAADTIVLLMAASVASEVARRLVEAGRPADQPVAVVHRAGRHDQTVTTGSLRDLVAHPGPLPSPSVLVIGDVAGRAQHARPLATADPTPAPPSAVAGGNAT